MNALKKGSGSSHHGPAIELQRILVPIDFSRASRQGLEFAGALAERFHSELHLLHVVEPPVLPEWGYAHIPRREAKLRRAADERLPQFPLECDIDPKLIHSGEIRSGEAADEICKVAADHPFDLIVMATHGHTGLKHFILGSVTENVVRHAPCPVLVVRQRERDFVKG